MLARSDVTVVEARVEEAVAMSELEPVNTMVVEVAFSPVPSVVNGKAKDIAVRQSTPADETLPLETCRHPSEAPERMSCDVEAMVEEKRVEDALVKVWSPVQLFGLVKSMSQSEIAPDPL